MTIIIPAYNPDYHLLKVVDELKNYKIIVVDDGSTSKEIFKKLKNVILLKHDINYGKGKAMKTAMEYVYKNNLDDGIIFVDADGQHKTNDIKKIINIFNRNKDSLILGVRTFSKDVPFKSRMGNKITKYLFRLFTGKNVSDTQTGLRAINTSYSPYLLKIEGNRYEYEMNMLLSVVSKKINIIEVPIETVYEDEKNSTSHFKVIRDSFLIYKNFLKFVLSGIICFIIDYISFILLMHLFKNTPSNIFLCNLLARLISGTCNYNINKNFVFNSNNKSVKEYIMLSTGVILINSLILNIFISKLKINIYLAKILIEIILFIVNFIIQNNVIFKEKRRKI